MNLIFVAPNPTCLLKEQTICRESFPELPQYLGFFDAEQRFKSWNPEEALSRPMPPELPQWQDDDLLILDAGSESTWLDRHLGIYQSCQMVASLMLVNHGPQVQQALSYIHSGVKGIVGSSYSADELQAAIGKLQEGQVYLAPELAQSLAMRQINKLLQPFKQLSSREFDIFCLLAEGYSLGYIAEQLDISSKTVSNCQTEIKRKLGADGRLSFKELAKKHGIIA